MSYSKGYMQGERKFEDTVQKCGECQSSERIEASTLLLKTAARFRRIYNRKPELDEGME